MSHEHDAEPVGIGKLMGVLALFLVPGAACAAFLWHALSGLLAGHALGSGTMLAAAGVLMVFLALLRGLWYALRDYGPGPV